MSFVIALPQKHRGLARNIELLQEELKEKKEAEEMSKLNHKNGDHGEQGDLKKLEEQGLIDPETKIGN